MFNFSKKTFESDASRVEVFQGITQSTILDIQAYVDDTFDTSSESRLDGGTTLFNVNGIPSEKVDEAIDKISELVGEKFEVAYGENSTDDGIGQTISIINK